MVNNSRKGIGIIILLLVVLIGVLTLGVLNDKRVEKINRDKHSEWVSSKGEGDSNSSNTGEESQPEQEPENKEEPKAPVEEKEDFYSKLKNKSDVRMLVLGDGLALSQGRNTIEGKWDEGIKNWITQTYGSKVEFKSLAKAGANSTVGLQEVQDSDINNYDLIIVCYGQNDNNKLVNIDTFKTNYQGIINKVKEKNPNGVVLPILPSTLTKNNPYRAAIQTIAANSGIKTVDVRDEFENSGVDFNTLMGPQLPNDKGYKLYTEAVTKVIKDSMK